MDMDFAALLVAMGNKIRCGHGAGSIPAKPRKTHL